MGPVPVWATLRKPAAAGAVVGAASGVVSNSGLIQATTGDITLAGHDVRQQGTLVSTSSVHTRGTVHLLADAGGKVALEQDSTTAIVLDPSATTAQDRRVAGAEGVADLLRELGPLSATQLALRVDQPDDLHAALHTLSTTGRAIVVSMAGETRWAAVEDAARLRDALGVSLPAGIAEVFLQPVADPLRDLLARYARSHGPFADPARAIRRRP